MTTIIAYITYLALLVSFVILYISLKVLEKSNKLLTTNITITDVCNRKTQPVVIGYENLYRDIK
jgi:hypothetical protein